MTIGEKIKNLREQHDLYQEDLAKRIGVSRQAVSAWELDRTIPTIGNAIAMSKVFHVDLNFFSDSVKENSVVTDEQEFLLLENFRRADKTTKDMVMRLLKYANIDEDQE